MSRWVLIGFVAFALGIAIIFGVRQWGGYKPAVELKGVVGGEKVALMEDEKIKEILSRRYGLNLQVAKSGSIEMVEEESGQNDFLFPGSQIATEIFKNTKGSRLAGSETIFNSPLVIYSWDTVADGLIRQGIARNDNGIYTVDLPRLVKVIVEGRKWNDIGVPLYGKVTVVTTDPLRSNSGAMFAGLLANILVGEGAVADESTVENILPTLKTFFARLGLMERTSDDLFASYLTTGEGARPLVIGYENQMVEFALLKPDVWNRNKGRVRVLYPVPTCWSAHQLLALNEKSRELIRAFSDPEVQRIAWERHGFRTGQAGSINDPNIIAAISFPDSIQQVVPLPNARTMNRILEAIRQ